MGFKGAKMAEKLPVFRLLGMMWVKGGTN